ncbi:MAG: glycosyl hydrolase family 28-related protein [Rikenellaceae bacterium]
MKKLLLLFIACATCYVASAQYYDAPEVGDGYKTITEYGVKTTSSSDSSAAFQRAMDEIFAEGGGVLYVPKGRYQLSGVEVREGVSMLVEAGAVFAFPKSAAGSGEPMFNFGQEYDLIHNVVVKGVNGRFKIDLSSVKSGASPLRLCNIHDFKISNIDFDAAGADHSMILCAVGEDNDPKVFGPIYGKITNCSCTGAGAKGGLIATEAARWILYDNLSSEGGVTVRLEISSQDVNRRQFGGAFDLRLMNISNKNGYAAVTLAPYSLPNGKIKVERISTEGSTYGVVLERGFVMEGLSEGTLPGSFGAGTYVDKVESRGGVALKNEANYKVDITNIK